MDDLSGGQTCGSSDLLSYEIAGCRNHRGMGALLCMHLDPVVMVSQLHQVLLWGCMPPLVLSSADCTKTSKTKL